MRSREERPKKPDKHGKGKIIIMWLLFMPLFAIGVTCLVNTFNDSPNTNTETTIEQQPIYYETNEVNTIEDLIIGNVYFYTNNYQVVSVDAQKNMLRLDVDFFKSQFNSYADSNITSVSLNLSNTGSPYLYLGGLNAYVQLSNTTMYFVPTSIVNSTYVTDYLLSYIEKSEHLFIKGYEDVEVITYIQNDIFYYAVDKVQQSPLFNWSSNNIVYTSMHSMCTTMNITSTFVPFILSYWILISIIYMLFDIEFTLLWKLHEKIHDLTESL